MITTIFIDVDDTLLDFEQCARQSMCQAMEENAIAYQESYFADFTRINNGLWNDIEQGTLTVEELRKIRWNLVFAQIGISLDGEKFENQFLTHLRQSAITVPGAEALMRYLAEKYMVCVASNAPYEQQRLRLEKAGLYQYVTQMFVSEKIGFSKPQKRFFDGCFAALPGVSPEQVLLIGDSLTSDVRGGLAYGIRTCWFNFRKKEAPKKCKPSYTVYSLEEIRQIV